VAVWAVFGLTAGRLSLPVGEHQLPIDRDASLLDDRFELGLLVDARNIGVGRRAAAQFAEEVGLDAETIWRVRLAVSEAVSNVVRHAHSGIGCTDHVFTLLAVSHVSDVQVTVLDHGRGLQARADSPGMGVGLSMIAQCCDALDVRPGAEDVGTMVVMTFLRHRP
jgi:anti-sigma regulatory factor (Ser/Thr protein kinase)